MLNYVTVLLVYWPVAQPLAPLMSAASVDTPLAPLRMSVFTCDMCTRMCVHQMDWKECNGMEQTGKGWKGMEAAHLCVYCPVLSCPLLLLRLLYVTMF